MSERPTPCPDCGSELHCYTECHWDCDARIDELEAKVKRLDHLTDEQVLLINSQERQIEDLKAEVLRLEADVKAEWKKGYTLGLNDGFSQ